VNRYISNGISNRVWIQGLAWITFSLSLTLATSAAERLRPPAVPLVACDPYFSIWSPADQLHAADTVHWTGKPHRLTALLRLDGATYRVMGAQPEQIPAVRQTGIVVVPTRTVYTFESGGVALTLTFLTPALPDDLDLLARPVTYLTCDVRAVDGQTHEVQLYFDASSELAINTPGQAVTAAQESMGDLTALKIGSKDQAVLAKRGDDIRIDWGYLYVAAPRTDATDFYLADRTALHRGFVQGGAAALAELSEETDAPAACVVCDLGHVAAQPVSHWLMIAYDDLYSIQYMKKNLRPYWRRTGWEASDLLQASAREYAALQARCAAFDEELLHDLTEAGGANYAALAALAYRQCFAAGKFVVDDNGQPLQFCKENHSNGCIATSDVFYPMAPQFLLFGPTLTKSFLVPFMNYAASQRWKFPFAPHDLGQYPHANGQRYGGGESSEENQMPVEESGNLLLLMAAVAQMEGHADFASLYWPQLEQWAEFLKAKGFDPENQLCTDDFAGHLAHNVNLSAKAICGLSAFAKLCEMRGDLRRAAEYRGVARDFARRWIQAADDGDHFRLAFDRPGTWSQKYNLVWDRILGLHLFPDEVLRKEMAFYRKTQNRYGLPLDNRETYTKLDWILWTATLTQDRADFEALVDPVVDFLNDTPDRVPMTDWYFTDTGRRRGFTARPVVGAVFLRLLYDRPVWLKYASRDTTRAADWAPMPTPPRTVPLVPTSQSEGATWRYTLQSPPPEWAAADFADQHWQQGPAGFGVEHTPGAVVRTVWNSSDIWLRRTFELQGPLPQRAALRLHHDEDCQIYINGKLVLSRRGYTTDYESEEFDPECLREGQNVIAVHCKQTTGGQYIDVGIDAIEPNTSH
jgi:hypothetical protein